ncbi:hypothetical protein SNE40_005808 [Patella caerulea]|uniref:GP-PDE domain-containing protein n=1 Tax=Patella caerulea TaxID=87958 RepID=A0AAN8K8R6_PATCE
MMGILLLAVPAVIYVIVKQYRFKQLPKQTVDDFMKLVWNKDIKNPGVILHRGGNVEAPENTLEAIKQAKESGCCGVEIDISFTKDGVGILLHDDTVDRTTDGTGNLENFTLSQVQQLNAAAKHKKCKELGHCKIPTLEEGVDLCLKLNLLTFLDCKGNAKKTADLVCRLFQEKPELYKTAVVCSFFPQIIYAVRSKDASIMTALTFRTHWLSHLGDGTPRFMGLTQSVVERANSILRFAHSYFLWYFFGNTFYLLNMDMLSRDVFLQWKKRGIHCIPWTVNHPIMKKYCIEYLHCPIITDGLDTKL